MDTQLSIFTEPCCGSNYILSDCATMAAGWPIRSRHTIKWPSTDQQSLKWRYWSTTADDIRVLVALNVHQLIVHISFLILRSINCRVGESLQTTAIRQTENDLYKRKQFRSCVVKGSSAASTQYFFSHHSKLVLLSFILPLRPLQCQLPTQYVYTGK